MKLRNIIIVQVAVKDKNYVSLIINMLHSVNIIVLDITFVIILKKRENKITSKQDLITSYSVCVLINFLHSSCVFRISKLICYTNF